MTPTPQTSTSVRYPTTGSVSRVTKISGAFETKF